MSSVRIIPMSPVQAGGQGTVWEGEIEGTGIKVALKYLTPDPASPTPAEDRKRFLREVRCQAELSHPNIVRVLGHNTEDDPPWYYMHWAATTLRAKIKANPTGLPEAEAIAIFAEILDAIEYAHSEGVLHRDLKPENVISIDGVFQVSDFGLSRQLGSDSATLTMTNVGMGTLAYGAPEQFVDAHSADQRADVFSLGKILYELLTGKLPFPTVDIGELQPKFRYVVQKAIHNDPDRRYRTVAEMAREVKLLSEDSDALQPPTERAKRLLEEIVAGNEDKIDDLNRLLSGERRRSKPVHPVCSVYAR
jgi:serine/threonine protein kinase